MRSKNKSNCNIMAGRTAFGLLVVGISLAPYTVRARSILCANVSPGHCCHRIHSRTRALRACSAVDHSKAGGIASLASRAASAMGAGCALIEPNFLTPDSLVAARTDMGNVFAGMESGRAEFHSLQTDLLMPEFRQQPGLPFAGLLDQLEELRLALSSETGRKLLDGGGLHLMRYPVGSKFMRHVDEDASLFEPIRNSISFLIYLTPDDWSESDGGALLIYEDGGRDSQDEGSPPRSVLPLSGTLVIYDSATEHEVLPTQRERDLLSGRFRETNEDWGSRRRARGGDLPSTGSRS